MEAPKYKRVLLKLSGEALAGEMRRGMDFDLVKTVAAAIRECTELGVQVGIVVGGGNYWRGVKDGGGKMERTRADQMGMLATTINALGIQEALEQEGLKATVMSGVEMPRICPLFTKAGAVSKLQAGEVVIFAGGTGNPFFSTDTAAALRACEIEADAILLAKNVDGVYDADPAKVPTAKRFDEITYQEVLARGLQVMDTAATSLAMENKMPLLVFALKDPGNIKKVLCGEKLGTLVH